MAAIALRRGWDVRQGPASRNLTVVAARASSDSRGVMEVLRTQPCHRTGVAGIALLRSRNMADGLSRGNGAVVASRAAAYRGRIVNDGFSGREVRRDMARIATCRRRKMRCMFSRRLKPVMATCALTRHVRGVPHYRRGKGVLVVAIQARLRWRSRNMCRGARYSGPNSTLQMAPIAVTRHAFCGHSCPVTRFACYARMHSFQHEARGSMIEVRRILCLPIRRQVHAQSRYYKQQRDPYVSCQLICNSCHVGRFSYPKAKLRSSGAPYMELCV
jgi:hypothetical protein